MTDKKPSKQPSKQPIPPQAMSSNGLSVFLISAFVAAVGANSIVDAIADNTYREHEKSAHLASLEKKLLILEQEVSALDLYLTSAEEGTIDASQCDVVDVILETTDIVQEKATWERELLSQVDYLSVSESISYRKRQDKAFNQVNVRLAQLKDICQRAFTQEVPEVQQGNSAPPEWWRRSELSFHYDQ